MMAASKVPSEDRLERKRQNARLRQQRCRARKRAAMAAAIAASKVEPTKVDDEMTATDKVIIKRKRKPIKPVLVKTNPDFEFKTTVDGVRMSKRAAAHAAALEEHNRIFFAQVEAERENAKHEESMESMDTAPISHVVVKNGTKTRMHPASPPSRTGSPMHRFYHRHASYHHGPYHAPYGYGHGHGHRHGPGPHGKYMPPHPHHHHAGYPVPPPQPRSPPAPMYRSSYEGRYHHQHTAPLPPPPHGHGIPHGRHYPVMAPPQHSMMEKPPSTTTMTAPPPTVVPHSVSEDDRSTPTPEELTPTSGENSCSDEDSLQSMEQEAIAAMLTLSNAAAEGCEEEAVAAPRVAPPQRPLLMSQ